MTQFLHNDDGRTRLMAKLVRDVLSAETFTSLADLTEAVKSRCAKLHIAMTPADLTQAYRLIESNYPLPKIGRARRIVPAPRPPEYRPFTRDEARAWSTQHALRIKTMSGP
jgi:hypothetical protein